MTDLKVHSTVQKSWIPPHFLIFCKENGTQTQQCIEMCKDTWKYSI